MLPLPPVSVSATSSAKGESTSGDIYGSPLNFNTGYFGTGTDTAGLIQRAQLPIIAVAALVVLWLLKKK